MMNFITSAVQKFINIDLWKIAGMKIIITMSMHSITLFTLIVLMQLFTRVTSQNLTMEPLKYNRTFNNTNCAKIMRYSFFIWF